MPALPEIVLDVVQVQVYRVQEVVGSACNTLLLAGDLLPLPPSLAQAKVLAERWNLLHSSTSEK
jgi:hypothetical protein